MVAMTASDSGPSSTQIGAIAERVVANQLVLCSHGQLSPYFPLADDDGIDLLVYAKSLGKALALQIKANTRNPLNPNPFVQFNIGQNTFIQNRGGFLLGVQIELDTCAIPLAWLIPMADIPTVGRTYKHSYRIRATPSPRSRDRFTPYRCLGLQDVTRRLLDVLEVQP